MAKTPLAWKEWYEDPAFEAEYTYRGRLGASCTEAGTSFALWCPAAGQVTLNLYRDGMTGDPVQWPMKNRGRGVWALETRKNLDGWYYDYDVTIQGETVRTTDPYARSCSANGTRDMVLNLARTDPEGWAEDRAPEKGPETFIWEAHVKEFSWDRSGGFPEAVRGKYLAFTERGTTLNDAGEFPTGVDYLRQLGITHVQLMPIYDLGSVDELAKDPDKEFNWGYDPVNYFIPEGSYATDPVHGEVRVREVKQMVQALHRAGLRVNMDVVFNHTYQLDTSLQRTVPWYFYRLNPDGTLSNGSGCGNDIAAERPMARKLIVDAVLYWAREYHIDGFRVDLMGLLPVSLMNEIQKRLDDAFGRGEKMVYGEPWSAGPTALSRPEPLAVKENFGKLDVAIAMFSDDTRDAIKGSVFNEHEPGFINGMCSSDEKMMRAIKAWRYSSGMPVKAPSQIITYVSAHDNQTLWDKLAVTTGDEELRLRQNHMAAAVYMTCQGIPFMLSGEEFARTKDGNSNSYNAPIRVNRLDWSRAFQYRGLVRYYQGLIALRKQIPGLCDKSEDAWRAIKTPWHEDGIVGFFVTSPARPGVRPCRWRLVYILYNSTDECSEVPLPQGEWRVLLDGEDSFLFENAESEILTGGEFRYVRIPPVSVLILGEVETA